MITFTGYKFDTDIFSDNYDFENELDFTTGYIYGENDDNEPSLDIVSNVRVQIYRCPKECILEEAEEAIMEKYYGDMSITSQDYGYSEYTIEGFSVYDIKIGNHDLIEILNSTNDFKILTIEKIKESK